MREIDAEFLQRVVAAGHTVTIVGRRVGENGAEHLIHDPWGERSSWISEGTLFASAEGRAAIHVTNGSATWVYDEARPLPVEAG